MTAALIIGLAVLLAGIAVWGEHFRGRPWREGLHRLLHSPSPMMGSSDDMGVKIGATVELAHDLCDLCGHERSSHVRMRGPKFASYEDRCARQMGRFEVCKCGRFTRFHQLTIWGRIGEALYPPFWFG